jgi:hypothetical protein
MLPTNRDARAVGDVVASIAIIPETGELWIALWLLIMGVRPQAQPLVPALA